jgi:hypothetical protein
MQCVLLETPCSGNEHPIIYEKYAKACIRDSLLRNEAPLSGFLLYKQPDILNHLVYNEKILGRLAELEWSKSCKRMLVYKDLGITKEMQRNIDNAIAIDQIVEYRILNDAQFKKENIAVTTEALTASSGGSGGNITSKKYDIPDFLKFT